MSHENAQHWIFNTNETHGQGAYQRMFRLNIATIYGYKNGPRKLQQGAKAGDQILAYVGSEEQRVKKTWCEIFQRSLKN